jgi:hypothetical protein
MVENNTFSPFEAPVKEPKLNKTETSGGIRMEPITDAELDGKPADVPKDAPTFQIPKFDEIPNAPLGGGGFGAGDPMAPGASNSGGGGGGNGPGSNNTAADGTKVDSGFAKEFSEYTAKWLVDIFFRLLIAGFQQYAKIDKVEIIKAVDDGFIDKRFLNFVDEANSNVEKSISVSDDEKKFVIEPLKYFLEVKKIQLKPEWMFVTGLLMVGGGLFIKAMDIKNQNKAMLDKIIKESAKIREEARTGTAESKFQKRNQEPTFHENVENFVPPVNNAPNNFSNNFNTDPTPKKDGGIEVVDAEVIDNDDN